VKRCPVQLLLLLLTWPAHALPTHCCCRYAFFDTDNVIEMAHPGESVSDIFKKYGEDYFRNCESQVRLHAALGCQSPCLLECCCCIECMICIAVSLQVLCRCSRSLLLQVMNS
jgi:hypothetical protein